MKTTLIMDKTTLSKEELKQKHFKKKIEIGNLFKQYYKNILELPYQELESLIKV